MKTGTLSRRYGYSSAGLSAAVKAMRIYIGSVDYASVVQQQRLYARANRAVAKVASSTGLTIMNAWDQIEIEARRQGVIRPVPGQHM
jgi:hypothetical protein